MATNRRNRTALGTCLLVGFVWSLGLPCACSKRLPASPDPLPICEGADQAPPFSAWADTPCPTPEEIAIIRQEINITFDNPPPSPTVCRGEGLPDGLSYYEERLYAQLLMFRTVQIDTPLPWTNLPLWDWLRHAIAGIVVETGDHSFCCGPAKVIHIGFSPRSLSAESNWRRAANTLLQTVIMHEARHAETGRGHTCSATKDNTISELAAFGVQELDYDVDRRAFQCVLRIEAVGTLVGNTAPGAFRVLPGMLERQHRITLRLCAQQLRFPLLDLKRSAAAQGRDTCAIGARPKAGRLRPDRRFVSPKSPTDPRRSRRPAGLGLGPAENPDATRRQVTFPARVLTDSSGEYTLYSKVYVHAKKRTNTP